MGAADRPSFQFYPGDWRRDINVRTRSLAARGLWLEMLCLMHDGEPYGHLAIGGKPISSDQLAGLVGRPAREVKLLLQELAEVDVYSVNERGLIFSRRMVRDEDLRRRRGEQGMKGAEHGWKGAEHGWKGGRPRKPPINPPIDAGIGGGSKTDQKPAPSSSSSSSKTPTAASPPGEGNGSSPSFETFWKSYPARKSRKRGRDEAEKQWQKLSPEDRVAALYDVTDRLQTDEQWRSGFPMDAHRYLRKRSWKNDETAETELPYTPA